MSNKTSAVVKTNPRKAVMIGCGFVGSASVFALMQRKKTTLHKCKN